MSEAEAGDFSIEIVLEKFNNEDSHTVVCKGPAGSAWSLLLMCMNPSGPSQMLAAAMMQMDAAGEVRHPAMGIWPSGLYVARAVPSGTNPEIPAIGDFTTALKVWVGENEPANLEDALIDAVAEQTDFADREVRSDGFTGDNRLRLQVLVEGCLLDFAQKIEGGFLMPLQHTLEPGNIIDAVHRILPDDVRFNDTAEMFETYGRAHPLCLVTFLNVQAPGHREAIVAVRKRLSRVLAGLAENRGATPHPIAFATDRDGAYNLSVDEGIYRGNLIGGFGPGVTGLLDMYERAAQKDPWIDFALELMRAIRAQRNEQTQLFMAWSLIEAAAKRRVPAAATAILDDAGNPVPGRGGKPLSQSNDLGRVIVYLRDHVGRNMLGLHAGAPEDFFDQILLAYRCRNQIAHEGGISAPGATPIAGYSAQLAFSVKDWAAEVIRHESIVAAR